MKRILFITSLVLSLYSCNKTKYDAVTILPINLSESIDVAVDEASYETVEIKGENLLGRIDNVTIDGDLLLIKDRDDLIGFNLKTGVQTTKFSRQGRAGNEYLSIWDTWIDNNLVYLTDMNSKKIMSFNYDGTLQEQITVGKNISDNPFQHIVRCSDDYYIGKRVFGVGEIPELSLYDKELKHVMDFDDFLLRSGMSMGNPFHRNHEGKVLYIRGMMNDIYEVSEEGIVKLYTIDFGRRNIPELENFKDEYAIIQYANEASIKYATHIHNIYDSKNYLCFSFLTDSKKGYAVYDKRNKSSKSYFFSKNGYVMSTIETVNDTAYLFWQNESGQTQMSIIGISEL